MEFIFKKASCIAIGSFNIYVVQPRLLGEMGVIPMQGPVKIQSDLSAPGTRLETGNYTWIVRPDRLAVETEDQSFDCGQVVSQVLNHLKWTPVVAVGCNAEFRTRKGSEHELLADFRLPTPSVEGLSQRTVHVAVKVDNSVLNAQLSETDEHLELSLNIHTDFAKRRQELKQSDLNRLARDACDSLMASRRKAVEIASRLTGGVFIYEHAEAE